MYSLDQISNAAAQLTGESLEGARLRLGALQRFDRLIPAASADQALLESVLASALGAVDGRTRPFGVREAKPVDKGLVLRVERAKDVQALFELLPYRPKRGPWSGVRGLFVQTDGTRLRFGFRTWLYERSWRSAEPSVWVAGPYEEDLPALLNAHEEQVRAAGHSVQWDPQCPEPGPKRQEPVTRSLVRRLSASYAMGSALLRRPRLWDSLSGYAGIRVDTRLTDYGLDWIVERQVTGWQFDDTRLIEVLSDHIVGCGLRVLDHACGTEECTVRLAPQPGVWGWRGVLTVHSRHAPSAPHIQVPGPRPLTAIGDCLSVSRPQTNTSNPDHRTQDRDGAVIQLTGAPRPDGVRRDDLSWVAEQIAAVWTARGLAAAVILTRNRDHEFSFGDPGQPAWATAPVPEAAEGWRRLRIAPPPGELWALEVSRGDDAVAAALAHARRAYDRVILIGRNDDWPYEEHPFDRLADARILVHRATPYERHIPLPTTTGQDVRAITLTPAESAVQWRQQELGRWTPRHPLTGMLLLISSDGSVPPDDFDLAVEEQLARYGTPILGRFPTDRGIIRGPGYSPHPPTVLDPQTEHPTHAQMAVAADALARHLWPDVPPATELTKTPDTRTSS
ncbi:hypothetical protein GCM10010218_05220 [Streptomyces mashuensis]|uniref:Uncharacterized protein n=1 Tax=Streptomyces mashuensis TaxID=33904 RepID=A0A919AVI0_9ACTN|nr:hypothetical protein [Streptomyces mashuensis]GHF27235.1 hypothetical protein GCM10010218_05220 [Streptomyces mashuensis]